jgi:predicted DNA-binding transcriptional regulator AlpA
MTERLLSDREVSQITGRARSTALVRYRASDVEAYIASLPSRRSTSEPAGQASIE